MQRPWRQDEKWDSRDAVRLAGHRPQLRSVLAAHTPEQHAAWDAVEALATEFKSADKILISVLMWNFGVPYILKHYIDVITQPGLTFSFNPATGFAGLVTGRPATVIQSSAATYLPGSGAEGFDFLTGYLKTWLEFIGFTDIRSLAIAPTGTDPDTLSGIAERAVNYAKESAHAF